MAQVTRICKNCGKAYVACRTAPTNAGTYRWQDVGCSPECGAAYLNAVLRARHADRVADVRELDGTKVVVEIVPEDGTSEDALSPAQTSNTESKRRATKRK